MPTPGAHEKLKNPSLSLLANGCPANLSVKISYLVNSNLLSRPWRVRLPWIKKVKLTNWISELVLPHFRLFFFNLINPSVVNLPLKKQLFLPEFHYFLQFFQFVGSFLVVCISFWGFRLVVEFIKAQVVVTWAWRVSLRRISLRLTEFATVFFPEVMLVWFLSLVVKRRRKHAHAFFYFGVGTRQVEFWFVFTSRVFQFFFK